MQFLRQFETKREVAEFLANAPESAKHVDPINRIIRDSYAAIIYSLIGDVERQKELMKRAYDASRGKPGEAEVEELYKKFG